MAEWVGLAAQWLQPIYREIAQEVLKDGYVQVDETPVRYLAPGHGRTKLGYLWACGAPGRDVARCLAVVARVLAVALAVVAGDAGGQPPRL